MNCLSPSILSADYVNLEGDIRKASDAGAQYLHLDVMDGHFVPGVSFGQRTVKRVREITDQVLDVHLMIDNPDERAVSFAEAGADIVTVHAESSVHLDRTIRAIKEAGAMAGVALCPATPPEVLTYVLPEVDMVLLMSVNPGLGGQKFIPYTLEKIDRVRQMVAERHLKTDIGVDGGVTTDNLSDILDAGANVIVAGSAIFQGDIGENVKEFLARM